MMELARKRMKAICEGIAAAYAVEVRLDLDSIFDVLINHEAETGFMAEAARDDVVGDENVITRPRPMMGSEDFADMLRKAPGCYARVGHSGDLPLHNPGFILDDAILPVGASLLARIVERRLAA